jgi:malate synthase
LKAASKDVFDYSKSTTLPVSLAIAEEYTLNEIKIPWFIDLLNLNLNNINLGLAKERIALYMEQFKKEGTRITRNLDVLLNS